MSPAYDLNPVPTDVKARALTTNIDLDEGTCSLDLLEEPAGLYALTLAEARAIIKEVATPQGGARPPRRSVRGQPRSTVWPVRSITMICSERQPYDESLPPQFQSALCRPDH
ncbi:hypothetical protein AMJ96_PB00127 (plasmid) [Rhizobium sp. N113]|uniref:Hypothetical conserved protein n=1 Tax=Rhizobium etli (strain CIAT 652) TaxID=491916 RepID=B3Q2B2_RHIE6|nr:hypothetical conserved protein [Rhizobium etli CIAT 652]ANL24444.1 hypothetical protein AMJ96_PB00127 [Rhizobium sp. N113]